MHEAVFQNAASCTLFRPFLFGYVLDARKRIGTNNADVPFDEAAESSHPLEQVASGHFGHSVELGEGQNIRWRLVLLVEPVLY